MTYEELKKWMGEKENKKQMFWVTVAVVTFFVGFGTGKYVKPDSSQAQNLQPNYTTKKVEKPVPAAGKVGDTPAIVGEVAGTSTPAVTADCPVKGNIGSSGKKLYHVKGGAFYDRTKAEQCFNTAAEAQAAGYTKSQR